MVFFSTLLGRLENQVALAGRILGSIQDAATVEVSIIDTLSAARQRLARARDGEALAANMVTAESPSQSRFRSLEDTGNGTF
jgi:hypothetical protein